MHHVEIAVRVHAPWNGCTSAMVHSADLHGLHWLQPGGAPRPLLHAYVDCDKLTNGSIPHACVRGSRPHSILVCILKRHAMPEVYAGLAHCADSASRVERFPPFADSNHAKA